MIDSLMYAQRKDAEFAKALAKQLEIKAKSLRYSNPSRLVIGHNMRHEIAGKLSKLPLVVFDKHTELFCNQSDKKGVCYNWLTFQLKQGREVHLVLTEAHYMNLHTRVPEGSKLKVYSNNGPAKIFLGFDSKDKAVKKEVLGLEELVKLDSRKKQISFDEDYLPLNWKSEKVSDLVLPIINTKDRFDWWFDSGYNTKPRKLANALYDICATLE